jgi:hypothetical protein
VAVGGGSVAAGTVSVGSGGGEVGVARGNVGVGGGSVASAGGGGDVGGGWVGVAGARVAGGGSEVGATASNVGDGSAPQPTKAVASSTANTIRVACLSIVCLLRLKVPPSRDKMPGDGRVAAIRSRLTSGARVACGCNVVVPLRYPITSRRERQPLPSPTSGHAVRGLKAGGTACARMPLRGRCASRPVAWQRHVIRYSCFSSLNGILWGVSGRPARSGGCHP